VLYTLVRALRKLLNVLCRGSSLNEFGALDANFISLAQSCLYFAAAAGHSVANVFRVVAAVTLVDLRAVLVAIVVHIMKSC